MLWQAKEEWTVAERENVGTSQRQQMGRWSVRIAHGAGRGVELLERHELLRELRIQKHVAVAVLGVVGGRELRNSCSKAMLYARRG